MKKIVTDKFVSIPESYSILHPLKIIGPIKEMKLSTSDILELLSSGHRVVEIIREYNRSNGNIVGQIELDFNNYNTNNYMEVISAKKSNNKEVFKANKDQNIQQDKKNDNVVEVVIEDEKEQSEQEDVVQDNSNQKENNKNQNGGRSGNNKNQNGNKNNGR